MSIFSYCCRRVRYSSRSLLTDSLIARKIFNFFSSERKIPFNSVTKLWYNSNVLQESNRSLPMCFVFSQVAPISVTEGVNFVVCDLTRCVIGESFPINNSSNSIASNQSFNLFSISSDSFLRRETSLSISSITTKIRLSLHLLLTIPNCLKLLSK